MIHSSHMVGPCLTSPRASLPTLSSRFIRSVLRKSNKASSHNQHCAFPFRKRHRFHREIATRRASSLTAAVNGCLSIFALLERASPRGSWWKEILAIGPVRHRCSITSPSVHMLFPLQQPHQRQEGVREEMGNERPATRAICAPESRCASVYQGKPS